MKFKKFDLCLSLPLMLLILLLIASCGDYSSQDPPTALDGNLDLSQWNFEKDGPLKLDGMWEFYWQQRLTPDDFKHPSLYKRSGFVRVPDLWTRYEIVNQPLPGSGYATFRLTVQLKDTLQSYGLKLARMGTAYQMWVNNSLVASNGIVATNSKDMVAQELPQITDFQTKSTTVEIVIQVSNFQHPAGGIWDPILMGTKAQIQAKREGRIAFELFIIGILIIIGIHHIGLYTMRKDDRSLLYFAGCCFLISIRAFLTGERFLMTLFPNIPWDIMIKVEHMSAYVAIPLVAMFVSHLYPDELPQKLVRYTQIVVGIFTLFAIVAPASIFIPTILLIDIAVAILGVYLLHLMVKAVRAQREDALIVMTGGIPLFIGILNDILNNHSLIHTQDLLPVGLFTFIIAQSYVLSLRFSRAYTAIETMSARLLSLDKLKDEFLANTSHELRTPLNGIIGLTESLIDGATGKLPEATVHNLSMIAQSGKRLANLINDILDFSKMKNQELQLQLKPVNVHYNTSIVLALIQTLVGQKSVTLHNDMSEEESWVLADENRLQQILMNLVGNAIKFTHEGSIRITAKIENEHLKISVIDTGIGIPEDKQDSIFSLFEQADGSIAKTYGGAGLGLAVSKQLIELHQGSIEVESKVGQGSTFSFTLPVISSEVETRSTPPSKPSKKKEVQPVSQRTSAIPGSPVTPTSSELPPGQSLFVQEEPQQRVHFRSSSHFPAKDPSAQTILIVDDEPVNIQVLQNQLSLNQYRILMAQDGVQALEIMKHEKPDLLLLDLMMPRMSGYEVCEKVRELHSTASLPIVILTAKNQVSDLVRGLNSGANDYLIKPFYKDELLARVQSHLQLKEAVESLQEKERLKMELSTAQTVQQLLIPHIDPQLETLEISSFYQSASETGGDWYDYHYYEEMNRLDILIGDVTGHGVPAALITAMADSVFHSMEEHYQRIIYTEALRFQMLHPSYFLNLLNSLLHSATNNLYAMTFCYSVIDLNTNTLVYATAGHPPCYVWRPSKSQFVSGKKTRTPIFNLYIRSAPLGYHADANYRFEIQPLEKDDVIVWYTDGLIENYNSNNVVFGVNRLRQALRECANLNAEQIRDKIMQVARQHYGNEPIEDDITLIIGRVK